MSPDLIIRLLSLYDVDIFRSIRLEALAAEPDAFATSYTQESQCSEDEWSMRLRNPVFVAFDAGSSVGMMVLRPRRPSQMAHRAELTSVYIKDRYRAMGLATELLKAVTGYAREIGVLQLELGVRGDNARAQRFYQREGFEVVGCVRNAFRTNDRFFDEVLMVLRVDQ